MQTETTLAPQAYVTVHQRPERPDRGKDYATRWIVVLDAKDADGVVTYCQPMGPQNRSLARAKLELREVRENNPAAYLIQVRYEAAAFA